MTRTGVLSLLIAAYAVTNTAQAYANPVESNPRFLQGGRSMQAFLYTEPTTDLDQLTATHNQIFNQFIDSTALRLEGHITTDKLYYRANDVVFVDLLVLSTLSKTPYTNTDLTIAKNITVSLLDSDGEEVTGVTPLNKLLYSASLPALPAHGFSIKLPTSISKGQYLIVVEHPNMATATRTIVVQDVASTDEEVTPSTDPYIAQFKFFGQQYISGILNGRVLILKADGTPNTVRTIFDITAINEGDGAELASTSVESEALARMYFSINLGNTLVDGDIVTISITGTLPDPSDATATVNVQFDKQITIGGLISQVTIQEIDQTIPEIDYTRFDMHFFTESMTDLVPSVLQTVYFRAFFAAVPGESLLEETFDFKGASLYAYNPNLPAIEVALIESDISSVKSGYGVLEEFRYDNSKIYFIEWTPLNWAPEEYEIEEDTYPIDETVILQDGTIRIPVIVEGIQSRISDIEKVYYQASATAAFPYYLLNDYTFTSTPIADGNGNSPTYGYANGYFFVKYDFGLAPLVSFPPVFVFNSFPKPTDFSNLLLNNTNGHIQGLLTDSEQTITQLYTITGTLGTNKISIDTTTICQEFVDQLYANLAVQFSTQISKLGLTLDVNGDPDTTALVANIAKLDAAFKQVPNVPGESDYFGKYGPIDEQEAVPALQTLTSFAATTDLTPPTVSITIGDKVLDNDEDLVLQISTNADFDTEEIYLLQIKQKELVLHQEIISLKRRLQKEKFMIDASDFPLANGGILQVNLYRITADYEDFIELIGTQTFCNIKTITSAYNSLSVSDQTNVDTASNHNPIFETITLALTNLKITVPGTTCVLVGPDLVQRFLESVGSISIFKKPTSAYHVVFENAPTSVVQGQAVSLTLKIKDTKLGTAIDDPLNPHYATVIVTENIDLDGASFYESSFPSKVYLENEIDFEAYSELDPLAQIDQHFQLPGVSLRDSTDQILDILLTVNNLRNSVFDAKVYSILENQEDATMVYRQSFPHTYERLSQMFGYNFQAAEHNEDPVFSESDIRNFASFVDYSYEVQSNIVDIDGEDNEYHRAVPDFDVYSSVTTAIVSLWKLSLEASYQAFNNKYQAETIYFSNNRLFATVGAETESKNIVEFNFGDTPADYKVMVYTYSADGFGYGEKIITVKPSFEVVFDLPTRIGTGDIVNVTATVYNAHGYVMTVTPSVAASTASNIEVDFLYTEWNKVSNKWVGTNKTTYSFASTVTSKVVSFQIKGLAAADLLSIPFTFVAALSNTTTKSITVTKTLTVNVHGLEKLDYFSGQISTSEYEYDFEYDVHEQEAEFSMDLPEGILIPSGGGRITLFPSTLGYMIAQARHVMSSNVVDRMLNDLLHKLRILAQFVNNAINHPDYGDADKYPELVSMVAEAKMWILAMAPSIQLFRVVDPEDSTVFLGYDYFRFSDQIVGDVPLTSYVAMTYSKLASVLVEDTTAFPTAVVQELIDESIIFVFSYGLTGSFDYPTNNFINSNVEDNILAAFIVNNYANTQHTVATSDPTAWLAIDAALPLILTNIKDSLDISLAVQAGEEFVVDPYTIAYTILALVIDPTTYQTSIDAYAAELQRYFQHNGDVVTPMQATVGGTLSHLRQDVMTIFGGVGMDRSIEVASLSSVALGQISSTDEVVLANLKATLRTVNRFLKKQVFLGYFGSLRSTTLANSVILTGFMVEPDYTDSEYYVNVTANAVLLGSYHIKGDYLPIPINFEAETIGLTAADAFSSVDVSVVAYGLATASEGKVHVTDPDTGIVTVEQGDIDSIIGWSYMYTQVSDSVVSNMTSQHGLDFVVQPLNPAGDLGLESMVGEEFSYNVTVRNILSGRRQGPLSILIRMPACLEFDSTQLTELQGPEADSPFQGWEYVDYDNEYRVFLRGLGKNDGVEKDSVSFVVTGTQVWYGTCLSRRFQAAPLNTFYTNVYASVTA